jgi:hypothetical protein
VPTEFFVQGTKQLNKQAKKIKTLLRTLFPSKNPNKSGVANLNEVPICISIPCAPQNSQEQRKEA